MKKIMLIVAALCFMGGLVANAQIKGEKYWDASGKAIFAYGIGGGAGELSTGFGWFVADKWEIGLDVLYGGLGDFSGDGIHVLGISPNFSYYHRIADRFYYTPGVSLNAAYVFGDASIMAGASLHLASFEFRPTEHFAMSVGVADIGINLYIEEGGAMPLFTLPIGLAGVTFKYYF